MKTRIITALLTVPALVLLVVSGNVPLISLVVTLVSLMGLWELYNAIGLTKNKALCIFGYIGAVVIVIINTYFNHLLLTAFSVLLFALFLLYLAKHKETNISDVSNIFLSLVYIPFFLSHITLIFKNLEHGNFLIWFVLVGAFITDSLAYFTGVFFGKHKLCPEISPKKTIEGFVGGVLGTGIVFLLMAYFNNLYFGGGYSLILMLVLGILSAVISALGDLFASQIKREYKVKDYGSLLPGHGGILDRCDSLIMVTPFLYYIFTFIF